MVNLQSLLESSSLRLAQFDSAEIGNSYFEEMRLFPHQSMISNKIIESIVDKSLNIIWRIFHEYQEYQSSSGSFSGKGRSFTTHGDFVVLFPNHFYLVPSLKSLIDDFSKHIMTKESINKENAIFSIGFINLSSHSRSHHHELDASSASVGLIWSLSDLDKAITSARSQRPAQDPSTPSYANVYYQLHELMRPLHMRKARWLAPSPSLLQGGRCRDGEKH
jgi:hypothetical protein